MLGTRTTPRLFLLAFSIFLVLTLPSSAQTADTPSARSIIDPLLDAEFASLKELYLHLHTHPELSFHESESAARVAEELERAGFSVTRGVGGTGVVGVLRNGPGPTVLIRGDMDALPVVEQTGLPYASRVTTENELGATVGVMHACGHDIHMTTLVGSARLLAALREHWQGTLVLIGQPAEERGAGARAMLADGLFERFPRPDSALALHVDATLEAGKVGYVSGFAMANVDSVDITIRGRGGHGAHPNTTKDPIVVAAQVVLALQTIVSREIAPQTPAVVTVGSIHGGAKHNVIPDEVHLQLTVRSYSDQTRDHLLGSIARIAKGIALAAGIPPELEPIVTVKDEYTPAAYNDPQLVAGVLEALRPTLGEENVVERLPSMGGEDFGRYGRVDPRIPIFMFQLGSISAERIRQSRGPRGRPLPSLHSSVYYPEPDSTIKTGVRALTAGALSMFK